MTRKTLALWMGSGLTLVAATGWAAGAQVLRTAAQIGSAPKFDVPAAGSRAVTGICVDIFRAMEAAQPGLRIVGDQNWLPAVRIEAQIAAGSLDIACAISRSRDDARRFTFIEPALFALDFRLAARRDDPVEIRNWDDVRGLAPDDLILVNHGWSYAMRLNAIPGLHVDDSGPTPDVNLKKLVRSRGRFFYFRSPGFSEAIAASDLCGDVRILPAVLEHADAYMIASRQLPQATVAELSGIIRTLHSSGQLDRIVAGEHDGRSRDACPMVPANADAAAPRR